MIMFVFLLLLITYLCQCTQVEWVHPDDGAWSTDSNWDPPTSPSESSSVLFSPPSSSITVTIDSHVIITNLTLRTGITLFFNNNASLTVLNSFTINGGTLQSNSSSLFSNTSTTLLVLDGFDFFLSSHILIITFNVSWSNGVFNMDQSSKLVLRNSQFRIDSTPEIQGSNQISGWGANHQGQLGILGNVISPPEDVYFTYSVREVSMGSHHALVLLANGDVYSAGSSSNGRLGRETVDTKFFRIVDVPKAIQVNAGQQSSFALIDDGTFYCWGYNFNYQLGLVPTTRQAQFEPVPNNAIDDVIMLAGKRQSYFALTSNGDVYSWGPNPEGCLCLGHEDLGDHPVRIKGLPPVEFVASGLTTYLILKNGSTMVCGRLWGSDTYYTKPELFDSFRRFDFIYTTDRSTVAIDQNQTLWTWGENEDGQLGDGTEDESPYPIPLNITVLSAATADQHSVAVDTEGNVLTWGSNHNQRLARATLYNGGKDGKSPHPIPDFERNPHLIVVCHQGSSIVFERMSPGVPPGFLGNGSFIVENVDVHLSSIIASFDLLALHCSSIHSVNVSLDNVRDISLSDSRLIMTAFSLLTSNTIKFELKNSELYLEGRCCGHVVIHMSDCILQSN
ncbi:hypothetical protein GEMRC1_013518 [Eukaryota sp. GEM-RC1]